jgi:hypothetical protein
LPATIDVVVLYKPVSPPCMRAMPKSMIFTCPSVSRARSSEMSRWTTDATVPSEPLDAVGVRERFEDHRHVWIATDVDALARTANNDATAGGRSRGRTRAP